MGDFGSARRQLVILRVERFCPGACGRAGGGSERRKAVVSDNERQMHAASVAAALTRRMHGAQYVRTALPALPARPDGLPQVGTAGLY